jgi:hypothetical protein
MKYWIYNCILIIIIIAFTLNNNDNIILEKFTPKIREMYRPLVRNARLGAQSVYKQHSSNMSNLFRRGGLL